MPISIGRGENRGREVTYHNVVRNLLKVGDWNGTAGSWTVPLENISRDGVDAAVVYVQDGSREKPGADAGRGLYVAALNSESSFDAEHIDAAHPDSHRVLTDSVGSQLARAGAESFSSMAIPKRKRTNFRWPSMGINYSCEQARS